MRSPDLVLLHAPHVYDFRKVPQLYGPVSDLVPATPVFEMYPLGFTSLAEYLENAGYRVRIVNLAYRMLRDARFDAEKFIKRIRAPIFGIDLHWMVHAHGAAEIAKLVKKHHPKSKTIFGGFTASYYWRELIGLPQVDYVMRGDSTEEPMAALLRAMKSHRLGSVANLVWKDIRGVVRENALTHIPERLTEVMRDHYGGLLRQVFRYRDLKSIIPFKGWLSHPITAVYTCRGCEQACIFCGGSRVALKRVTGREVTAFRTPEEIHRDVKNISRVSRGPIFILSDIRQSGDDAATDFLHRLQREPVSNTVMFELYWPASTRFITDVSLAAPKFGFSISPHSHNPIVRRLLGLNYSNDGLEETISAGLSSGARRIEVYFMIGLPTETDDDVRGIIDLANRSYKAAKEAVPRESHVTVKLSLSVAVFIPKPHTPFQFCGQLSLNDIYRRLEILKSADLQRGIDLHWSDPQTSLLEAVLSRSGRESADLIEQSWKNGALFDAWSERFTISHWYEAAKSCSLNLSEMAEKNFEQNERLPWDHIDSGISKAFLSAEYKKSIRCEKTEDCSYTSCVGCGVCTALETSVVTGARRHV